MYILIVRPGAIGDALLTFPLLYALKTRTPSLSITFVSNAAVLSLAQIWRLADAVFDYGSLEWSELFTQNGIRSPALLHVLGSIKCAICWLRDPDKLVEHNLRAIGIPQVLVVPGLPNIEQHITAYLAQTLNMTLTGEEETHAFGSLITRTAIRVALHPGSGGKAKCWPIERFAHVIVALWQRNISVLLLTGPADTERLTLLLQMLPLPSTPDLLVSLVNAPLTEVVEQLQRCTAYLGNDSGITHLAALLGLPTIALFGTSNPVMWHPVGLHVHVVHQANMEAILIENVLSLLIELLTT